MDWIKKVTESHFEKKRNKTLEMFLDEWLYPAFPIDEVGIMLLARFFHGHIAIFVNEKWWSTRADKDLTKVNVFLVYRGNKVFDDTRMMTTEEYSLVKNDVRKYKMKIEREIKKMEAAEKAKAAAKKVARAKAWKENPTEGKETPPKPSAAKSSVAKPTHPMRTRRSKKLPSTSEESESEGLDLEKVMDEGVMHNTDSDHTKDIMHKPNEESSNEDVQNGNEDIPSLEQSTETCADENKDTLTENNKDITEKDTDNETEPFSSHETENGSDIMQKDTELTGNKADDIMQKENENGTDDTITKDDDIMHKTTEDVKASDAANSDDDMTLASVIEKEKKREEEEAKKNKKPKTKPKGNKPVVQPTRKSTRLNKDKSTKSDKSKKKKTTFVCSKCPKEFQTRNGLYKQEVMHSGLKYFCGICERGFVWQCELDDHERRHTDKRSERIKCKKPNCKKDYSSKRALQRHLRDDHGKSSEITCNFKDDQGMLCGKKSKSLTLHKQHYTHEHEGGFLTLCGDRVPWPNNRQKHHRECRKCLRIKKG